MMGRCKVEECNNIGKLNRKGNRYFPRGFCNSHYKKWSRNNRGTIKKDKKAVECCSVEGCNNPPPYKRKMCEKHYRRYMLYGDVNLVQYINGGQTNHYLYDTYCGMKKRCYSETDKDYSRYGGRGIKFCDRWVGVEGFFNFIEDMGDRPDNYTIDRIDYNGNYEPSNCRWTDIHTQAINKRSCKNKGVGFIKKTSKFRSRITVNGKSIEIGSFNNIEEATKARKEAETKYLGRELNV